MVRRVSWVLVAMSAASLGLASPASADRGFTPRFSTNDTGNIAFAAAPLMTCSTTGTNGAGCAAARTRTAADGPAGSATIDALNNNSYTMVPVDTDGDPATTVNSSTAALSLPDGATVLFAGLYWGADQSAGNNGGAAPAAGTAANRIKFKAPGESYQTLTASSPVDFGAGGNTTRYQGFADVTTVVGAAGPGTYAAGDVRAGTGGDRYAGWSLIVAYRDPAQPARNLTIFDGFKTIVSNAPPTTIAVSGFQTPPAGPVRTTVGFVSYEGDLGLGGDTATLDATTLTNAANGATNFFNSSISTNGAPTTTRDPGFTNTLGYDADLFAANGVLANGATDATIRLTTSSDQYLPGVITFATELYAPRVVLAKAVADLSRPEGPAQRGDTLRYTVTASNVGQDGADDFVLRDPIPAGTTYVPGSLRITAGAGAPLSPTDVVGDDRGEYDGPGGRVVLRLGTGAGALSGGRLAPGTSSTITFDARIGDVDPRFEVVNAADAGFVTQSLRVPLTGRSNEVTTVVAGTDLTLTKAHSPAFVFGSRSTFRLIVSNIGNLVSDGSVVTVSDDFDPAAFASIANAGGVGWTCALAGLTVTCTRSDVLAAGESYPPILVDAVVADPAPLAIVNRSTVAGGGDLVPGNNTATDVGNAAAEADLSIAKSVAPAVALTGSSVTYALVVLNRGPSAATAATVGDALPAGLTGATATTTRGTCSAPVATCALGDLAVGESATITVTATVTANATTIANTATVTSVTHDPNPADNSDAATIAVPDSADLSVTKTASTATPVAGAPGGLTYTVVLANAGPGAATGVFLQDDLPADFTPTAIAAPPGFSCNAPGAGQTLACAGAKLAAGASATFTVTGTVAAAPADPLLRNVARVRATTLDPDLTNNSDDAAVTATPSADLAVTKEWGIDPAAFTPIVSTGPNTTVLIRLTAANLGPSPATGVVLRDTLPAGVSYVSSDQGVCSNAAGVLTCAVGNLAVGAQFVVLVTVDVSNAAAGRLITNTATVAGAQDDPVGSDDSATATLAVTPAADLALTKTAAPAAVSAGDDVTYTLTVVNTGPNDATGVSVSDPLPAGLAFVSSAGCSAAGGTVTCAVGALAAGATTTRTYLARPTTAAAGTTVTNTATVTATTVDPVAADNSGSAAITVAPRADLSARKLASDTTPEVDQDVTFALVAANAGPNDATGVTLTDPVPAGMTFVAAEPGCAFTAAPPVVVCDVGDVAAGTEARRTVTLRPGASLAGQAITNAVIVAGDQEDPDPAGDRAEARIDVQPQADLRLTKTAGAASATPGGTLTYALTVTNDGPSAATGVTVSDPRAALAATPSQGACAVLGSGVTCALGTLAAGGQARVEVVVAVPPGAAGGVLENTATVGAAERDPRPQDNTASATVPVTTVPAAGPAPPAATTPPTVQPGQSDRTRLSLRKRASRATVRGGATTTFRLTVGNVGARTARTVRVCDRLPAGLTFVSAPGARFAGRTACWSLSRLAAGASRTFTVRVRADRTTRGRRVVNRGTATSANAATLRRGAALRVLADPSGARPGGVTG